MAGKWTRTRLADLAQLHREQVNATREPERIFQHFSVPAFDDARRPVRERGSAIGSQKLTVPRDAILVSKLNPRIPRVWIPDIDTTVVPVASTEFLVLRPRPSVDRRFLAYLFLSPSVQSEMARRATGTSGSHQRIRPEDALSIEEKSRQTSTNSAPSPTSWARWRTRSN